MQNPWLRRFSKFTCFSTFILIFAGSLVTSTGTGLSVPDWPLSYGTFFPPMVGGVRFEHTHRMIAGFVGILTLILAIWLARKDRRKWVRVLGFCALGAVIAQATLGGMTVLFFLPPPVSISHAVLAQTFFILTIIIAYSQSEESRKTPPKTGPRDDFGIQTFQTESNPVIPSKTGFYGAPTNSLFKPAVVVASLIYIQLILGALMRHTGSGLAIPDFPKMGGMWLPTFSDAMVRQINVMRFEYLLDPVSKGQVFIHFLHRFWALVVTAGIFWITWKCMVKTLSKKIRWTAVGMSVTVIFQISLGIAAVMTQKEAWHTSAHVATGAFLLGLSVLLALRIYTMK